MVIKTSGNVGIGTTTPNAKLDIQGTQGQLFSVTDDLSGEIFAVSDISGVPIMTVNSSGVSYFDGNVGIGKTNPQTHLHIANSGSSAQLSLERTDTSDTLKLVIGSSYGYLQNTTGPLSLGTTGGNQQLYIKTNGNVGIDNTNPPQKLTVNGAAFITNALTSPGSPGSYTYNGTAIDYSNNNSRFWSWGTSTNRGTFKFIQLRNNGQFQKTALIIDDDGNVGIGTTSPPVKFVVNNGVARTSTAKTYSTFVHTNDTDDFRVGLATAIKGGAASADRYISIEGASYQVSTDTFTNEDIDLVLNPAAGNVGIGTTLPGFKLDVHGDSTSGVMSVKNAANARDTFRSENAAGTRTFNIGNDANGHANVLIRNSSGITTSYLSGSGDSYLNGGNVGIGTTSPDFKLDVDGTFGVSDLPFNTDSVSVLVADEITGTEQVVNGSFTTDTDWNKNSNWTISGGTANADGTSSSDMNQSTNLPAAGEVFRVSFEITARTQGQVRIEYGDAATDFLSALGKYEYILTATSTDRVRIQCNGSFIGSVDNLSIKQITSASNQIQKRELGTGAFGPTPVGAYLPLTAGSGSPLTGTLYGTSTNYSGSGDYAGSMTLGTGASTQEAHLQIGQGRTDSGYSYIDLIGDATYTDYGLRIIRNNGGPNTTSAITHRGTGNFSIGATDSASILLRTNNVTALTLSNTQNAIFEGYVGIGVTDPGANLEIRGTVNQDDCKIYLKENGTYGAYFKYNGSGNRGWIGGITSTTTENAVMSWSRDGTNLKLITSGSTAVTVDSNRDVTFAEDIIIKDVLLSNQVNTDVDTGAEVVAQVAHATYTAAFFDFVIKKGTNVRSGTVYACHNGDTTPLVEFTETSTQDLGDTSDVVLSVDISGTQMRLLATVTSDDWSVKSLIRAI